MHRASPSATTRPDGHQHTPQPPCQWPRRVQVRLIPIPEPRRLNWHISIRPVDVLAVALIIAAIIALAVR